MLKVKIFFIFVVSIQLTLAAIVSRDPVKNQQPPVSLQSSVNQQHPVNPQHRRIESIKNLTHVDSFFDAIYTQNDFFDSLYNKNGKEHDLGADYGLTSDVYTKPNPFYNKKQPTQSDEAGMKFWYPVYNQNKNHSDTQDTLGSNSQSTETFNPVQLSYDTKSNTYSTYFSPSKSYKGSHYGAPPSPTYLPLPSPMPTYGPPSYSYPAAYIPHATYGAPSIYPAAASSSHEDKKSHESWFIAKILKKFDLVLISKLLLKFIIFKKIIKFIGIICLLLFIPALKKKFEEVADVSEEDREDEDEDRNGRNYKFLDAYANTDFRVKEIANFALTAIEGFESHEIPWCVGESQFYCRFQYMLDQIDQRYPLTKIPSIWFPALTTTARPKTAATSPTTRKNVDYNDFITESPDSSSIEESTEIDDNENS